MSSIFTYRDEIEGKIGIGKYKKLEKYKRLEKSIRIIYKILISLRSK